MSVRTGRGDEPIQNSVSARTGANCELRGYRGNIERHDRLNVNSEVTEATWNTRTFGPAGDLMLRLTCRELRGYPQKGCNMERTRTHVNSEVPCQGNIEHTGLPLAGACELESGR